VENVVLHLSKNEDDLSLEDKLEIDTNGYCISLRDEDNSTPYSQCKLIPPNFFYSLNNLYNAVCSIKNIKTLQVGCQSFDVETIRKMLKEYDKWKKNVIKTIV
jgi:hypothetical protein